MACKILHIGVFFDGTGNNKMNDTPEHSQSNIAKLSELYKNCSAAYKEKTNAANWFDAQKTEHKSLMIYENGVGTRDMRDKKWYDYIPAVYAAELASDAKYTILTDKYEKGGGGGGALRINSALNKVFNILKQHPTGSGDGVYRQRIIDVFGFSRGAAEARDFINTFYEKNKRLWHFKNVQFNFVGIYDTVGSFGIAGDNINYKPKDPSKHSEDSIDFIRSISDGRFKKDFGIVEGAILQTDRTAYDRSSAEAIENEMHKNGWKLESTKMGSRGEGPYTMTFTKMSDDFEEYNFNLAPKSANTIIHMIANDEVRKNFPLSSLNPIGGSHREWIYAGVHSDVGGGYEPMRHEPHGMSLGVYLSPRSAIAQANALKPKFPKNAKFSTEQVSFPSLKTKLNVEWIRDITNDITFVTLHRMYEAALRCDVPFLPMPDNTDYKIPPSMMQYNAYTKENYANAMSFPNIRSFKEVYRHHSAVDPTDVATHYDGFTSTTKDVIINDSPDGSGGNDMRYVDEYGREVTPRFEKVHGRKLIPKREVYPNIASKAILPV